MTDLDLARHMRGDIADAVNITDGLPNFMTKRAIASFVFFRFNRAYMGRKGAPT